MKYKVYQVLLQVGGWLSLLAPITVLCYMNREFYFRTVDDVVKICIGGVIGFGVIALISLKKLHMGGELIFAFIIVMLELLKTIIGDLQLIMVVVGISYTVDKRIFTPLAEYYKRNYTTYIASKINSNVMKKTFIQPIKQENMETRGIY